jgi:DNA-binding PadR family transcriptional regulator
MNTSSLEITSLTKFWHLIHSVIEEFWTITEPHIEEAAVRNNIPIELYYYGELGLNNFSVEEFQQRDPFSNPEQFERLFPRLEIKGWIIPMRDEGRYEVTDKAREAVRQIIQTGDSHLSKFESATDLNLERLLSFLKQIVLANNAAPEPPEKWAIERRFHVATKHSPVIVQIRECLMDLFAYHDDAHLSAARPHFNQAGIVWTVLGAVATGSAVTAEQMAETMSFRGYETYEYEAAIKAAIQVGWLETAEVADTFRPTSKGRELREQVEKLTDEYFYAPWTTFSPNELDEFYNLLTKLREQWHGFKKSI